MILATLRCSDVAEEKVTFLIRKIVVICTRKVLKLPMTFVFMLIFSLFTKFSPPVAFCISTLPHPNTHTPSKTGKENYYPVIPLYFAKNLFCTLQGISYGSLGLYCNRNRHRCCFNECFLSS